MAHSRGTIVMFQYLGSSPERAAQVNRYVNIDGVFREYLPGGVPTMALWAEGDSTREITGATNVRYSAMSHTEIATSARSFKDVYTFFLGRKPKTAKIVPEPPNRVTVIGRALNFPANAGIDGGDMRVFKLNPKTGQRVGKAVYRKTLGPNGNFGPLKVNGRARYEFAVTRPGGPTVHNYPEAFERDNHFYRVLSAPALGPFIDPGAGHTNISVTRMREFRGDQTGTGANDQLRLNGQNVINPAIAPRARRVLAVFNLDRNSDGVTNLEAPLMPFAALSFLTGADIFLPATADHSGTIKVTERMREPRGKTRVTNVPNWPSSNHSVSVYFKDYPALRYKAPKRKKCPRGKVLKKKRCVKSGKRMRR